MKIYKLEDVSLEMKAFIIEMFVGERKSYKEIIAITHLPKNIVQKCIDLYTKKPNKDLVLKSKL